MKLKTEAILLSVAPVFITMSPAWAGRVLRASAEAAREGNVTIPVHVENGGVLLDFSRTGERIEKISIDYPGYVVVDHCLVTKSCSDRHSPIIRLFRSTGINFPDIPPAKTTMLSVETTDSQGQYYSYPFSVTTGEGGSLVNKILIENEPNDIPFEDGILRRNTEASTTIALGLEEAISKSFLVDPQLKERIDYYIQLLEAGTNSNDAAQRAGISPELVTRLAQLGQAKALAANSRQQRFSSPPISLPTEQLKNKNQDFHESNEASASSTSGIAPLLKSPVSVTQKPSYELPQHHLQADTLARGLMIARLEKTVSDGVAAQIQDAIRFLRRGQSIAAAARYSGLRVETINQLLLAGRKDRANHLRNISCSNFFYSSYTLYNQRTGVPSER